MKRRWWDSVRPESQEESWWKVLTYENGLEKLCLKPLFTDFAKNLSRAEVWDSPRKGYSPTWRYQREGKDHQWRGLNTREERTMRRSVLPVRILSRQVGICGEMYETWTKISIWWGKVDPAACHVCVLETELSLCLWRTEEGWGRQTSPRLLQRAQMGHVEDRQKNGGGRAMGEQDSWENCIEGSWELKTQSSWHQC